MAVSRYNMLVSPFTLQSNGRWCDNAPAYGEKTGIGCFAMRVTNKLWKAWRAFMLACSKQKLLLATLLSIVFCHHTSPQMYHDMVKVLSRGYTYHLITYLRLHSTISSVRKSRSQVGTVTGCHRASRVTHILLVWGFPHASGPPSPSLHAEAKSAKVILTFNGPQSQALWVFLQSCFIVLALGKLVQVPQQSSASSISFRMKLWTAIMRATMGCYSAIIVSNQRWQRRQILSCAGL